MRRFTQIALLAAVAYLGSAPANASVSTSYSAPFGPGNVPFKQTLMIPKFNTALGTLTNVAISIMATGSPTLTVTNSSNAPVNFSHAHYQVGLGVGVASQFFLGAVMNVGPISGTAQPGLNLFPGGIQTVSNSTNLSSSFFPYYEGTGVMLATLKFTSSPFATGTPSSLTFGGTANINGNVTVTYTYTPNTTVIPEPTTVVALASGLVCLGLVRLRRKSA